MTNFDFADIILVPFPFTNQRNFKKRPAVVISSDDYNHERPDLILMAVTSQVKNPLSFGEGHIQDWKEAGLLKSSCIKPLIATIEQNIILRKLGTLSKRDLLTLKNCIDTILY